MNKRLLASLAVLLSVGLMLPAGLAAQLISLKTVPVASGDQFLIFPSDNLAMGGVSIALDDLRLDPFVNPAKGAWLTEPQVYSTPTFYSISNQAGSARTLPFGAAMNSGEWFGGAFAALQNLKRSDFFFGPVPLPGIIDNVPVPNSLSSQSATNKYAHFNFGRIVTPDLAIGASVFLSDLGGLDGVEHLYATASGIAQRGDITDLRIGISKKLTGDRNLEAVLLHNRFNMTHDVAYIDWIVIDSVNWFTEQRARLETNLDQTRTWGAHLGYEQAVGENGWRVGGILTANRKSHPKIPNYEIMNIPRDPGHSNAFDIGVGLAKVTEQTRFGLDLVYQPASSETWAEAEGPITTGRGDTIPKGGKTVENSFDFSNAFVNMGVSHDVDPISLQLGLRVAAYDFHLDQVNNVADTFRRQDENWMEWVPSWGLSARFTDFELRYSGRVTTGTGRPGIAFTPFAEDRIASAGAAPNDVLLAPQGPLTLQDATVLTHQFTISIPIR